MEIKALQKYNTLACPKKTISVSGLYMKNSENRSHLIFSEILINHLLIIHLHLYPAAGDFLNPDIS